MISNVGLRRSTVKQPPLNGLAVFAGFEGNLTATGATLSFTRVGARNHPETHATVATGTPAYPTGKQGLGVLVEASVSNLLSAANAAAITTSATCTTTAASHTVSVATGSLTLSGTMSGTVTPDNPITATATAGTLTLTGSATYVQVEAKAYRTSWQDPANGGRAAEVLSFNPTGLMIASEGSVGAWLYVGANAPWNELTLTESIFGTATSGAQNRVLIQKGANVLSLITGNSSGTSSVASTTLSSALAVGWHHVMGVWGGGANPKIYLDGVLKTTAASNNIPSAVHTVAYIGCDASGSNWCNAPLDSFRLYNRALTANEVRNIFISGR